MRMTSFFQTATGEWHWASVWALVGWIVAGGLLLGSLRINRNDRFDASKKEAANRVEINSTKVQLEEARSEAAKAHELAQTITKYQSIAKLNGVGKTEIISASQQTSNITIESETPISRAMMSTIIQQGERFDYSETDEAVLIYRHVIAQFPDFPFAHYALAKALNVKGDPEWRFHANNAVIILEKRLVSPNISWLTMNVWQSSDVT